VLQFIKCEKCDKAFLVGINNKKLFEMEKSSGVFEGDPYIAVDSDQISKAGEVGKKEPCPECGKLCKVDVAKPVDEDN